MSSSDFDFESSSTVAVKVKGFDMKELSAAEVKECKDIASERVGIQVEDAKGGDARASNSYGGPSFVGSRSIEVREEDAFIGTLAEYIGSKYAKCQWSKEMGQYKGNSNSDLQVVFRKHSTRCEVRGTRRDFVIYRPHQDIHKSDTLLIGISNLPNGPTCRVGHIFFSEMKKLVDQHPEWQGSHAGPPYYMISFEHLSEDFSEFGA